MEASEAIRMDHQDLSDFIIINIIIIINNTIQYYYYGFGFYLQGNVLEDGYLLSYRLKCHSYF